MKNLLLIFVIIVACSSRDEEVKYSTPYNVRYDCSLIKTDKITKVAETILEGETCGIAYDRLKIEADRLNEEDRSSKYQLICPN